MKKSHVLAGVTALAFVGSYIVAVQTGNAGCGCGAAGCPCGGGPKTSEVAWDDKIPTPVVEVADKNADKTKAAAPTWTAEELKSAKPLLVYYFVDGLTDEKDDSYKLSQRFETVGLPAEGVLPAIKSDWRAKKVAIDAKANRKDAKNQARVEFWSYTGTKVAEIGAKDEDQAGAKPLLAKLNSSVAKNRDLCKAELKKLDDAAKAKKTAK
jgi:hypothetical protein